MRIDQKKLKRILITAVIAIPWLYLLSVIIPNSIIFFTLALIAIIFGAIGWYLDRSLLLSDISKMVKYISDPSAGSKELVEFEAGASHEIEQLSSKVSDIVSRYETILREYGDTRKALEVSEKEYRTMIENSSFGAFRTSIKGEILFVNDGLLKMFGFDTKMEMRKTNVSSLYQDQAQRQLFLDKLTRDGEVDSMELDAVTKSGKLLRILISAKLDHSVIYGTIVNITDIISIQDRLAQSEEQYKEIIESSMDCICNISFDGEFISMNNAGCRLNELDDPNELIGQSSTASIVANREEAEKAIKAAAHGETTSLRYKSLNKNGREIWWDSKVTPVIAPNGEVVSALRISRDITEQLGYEEEIERARKIDSIGILAGGIAHDFNNILSAIIGNITLAQQNAHTHEEEKLVYNLEAAKNASSRAKDLTHQLLTFAKGGAPIRRTGLIADLLVESAKFITTGTGVKCAFEMPEDLWLVDMDEGQINQVINNIVINAVQSMDSSGIINISAENADKEPIKPGSKKLGRFVKISIADSGAGISREDLSKIFDPYFTTKKQGSGLGLSTCYSIIMKHDGKITVDSEIGKGTTFNIFLPASKHHVIPEPTLDKGTTEKQYVSAKILVMDDEEPILEVLTTILEQMGCSVVPSKTGQEAIELFKKAVDSTEPFKLVITDLTVPGGIGGKELLTYLKEMDPLIKVVVTSGYSASPVMSEYEKYGFSGVLPKPFDLDELQDVVQNILK